MWVRVGLSTLTQNPHIGQRSQPEPNPFTGSGWVGFGLARVLAQPTHTHTRTHSVFRPSALNRALTVALAVAPGLVFCVPSIMATGLPSGLALWPSFLCALSHSNRTALRPGPRPGFLCALDHGNWTALRARPRPGFLCALRPGPRPSFLCALRPRPRPGFLCALDYGNWPSPPYIEIDCGNILNIYGYLYILSANCGYSISPNIRNPQFYGYSMLSNIL
jgi:hypothetical protein